MQNDYAQSKQPKANTNKTQYKQGKPFWCTHYTDFHPKLKAISDPIR